MYALLIVVCPFVLLLLAIVLFVLLRYTDSDYPFGIFKLFLKKILHRKLKSNTNSSKIHVWISLNIFYLLNITNWDRTQVFPTYEGFPVVEFRCSGSLNIFCSISVVLLLLKIHWKVMNDGIVTMEHVHGHLWHTWF